jgi:hypothetical protein
MTEKAEKLMSTFQDLYKEMRRQKARRSVLKYLIEMLDTEFLPHLDGKPKKILLTDEKLPVDADVIDLVIQDLIDFDKVVSEDVLAIQTAYLVNPPTNIAPVEEAPAAAEGAEQEVPGVAPVEDPQMSLPHFTPEAVEELHEQVASAE